MLMRWESGSPRFIEPGHLLIKAVRSPKNSTVGAVAWTLDTHVDMSNLALFLPRRLSSALTKKKKKKFFSLFFFLFFFFFFFFKRKKNKESVTYVGCSRSLNVSTSIVFSFLRGLKIFLIFKKFILKKKYLFDKKIKNTFKGPKILK
jgi:hypothetical protein